MISRQHNKNTEQNYFVRKLRHKRQLLSFCHQPNKNKFNSISTIFDNQKKREQFFISITIFF